MSTIDTLHGNDSNANNRTNRSLFPYEYAGVVFDAKTEKQIGCYETLYFLVNNALHSMYLVK